MTKSKNTNKTIKEKKEVKTKICISCPADKAEKPVKEFYVSYNPIHADGRLPMCKDCIIKSCFYEDGFEINVEGLKKILRQLDKPFIEPLLQSSIDEYNKSFGGKRARKDIRKLIISYYFKNINSLPQYKYVNWEEGIALNEKIKRERKGSNLIIENGYDIEKKSKRNKKVDELPKYDLDYSKFEVTEEIIKLFGGGFTRQEYKLMWDKYNFLKQSYPDFTTLHIESLVSYVRLKVKEELAIARGDVDEATKWGSAAVKAAEKAKINPSQMSQNDLEGGISSISELSLAIEKAVDVVKILPKFKFRPNDAVDFTIWCYINYLRKLEDKPLCEYEDIYKFYDERKKAYLDQYGDPYGIFTDDPTEKNREAIEKFITLPSDYDELIENAEDESDGGVISE